MSLGKQLRSTADKVNDAKALETAEKYYHKIINSLEDIAKSGMYELELTSENYKGLYGYGAPLVEKHLSTLLSQDDITLCSSREEFGYYVKF